VVNWMTTNITCSVHKCFKTSIIKCQVLAWESTIAENVETFYDKIFTSDQQKAKLLKLLFAQILLLVIVVILNAG
jgi:hypothetical protein